MKKLASAALMIVSAFLLSTAAFADAALPPPGYRLREMMESVYVPIILAVVIILIVILVKVLAAGKKRKRGNAEEKRK